MKPIPELQTALDRLKMVSTFRSDFETLGTHPAKVDNLLLALKRLVIVPPKQAGALKESYLKKVADGKALKDIQKMVAVIRKEFPNLYRMEADFLDSVAKVKGRSIMWKGTVAEILSDPALSDHRKWAPKVIRLKMDPSDGILADLRLRIPIKMQDKMLRYKKGDHIVFKGNIVYIGSRLADHVVQVDKFKRVKPDKI